LAVGRGVGEVGEKAVHFCQLPLRYLKKESFTTIFTAVLSLK